MAIVGAIPFRLGLVPLYSLAVNNILPTPSQFLQEFILINLTLMLFNLIPFSPLDGEKILDYFLPANMARAWDRIRPYGPVILLVVVFVLPYLGINVLGAIIDPPITALWHLLTGA